MASPVFTFGRVGSTFEERQTVFEALSRAKELGYGADRANLFLRTQGIGYSITKMRDDYKVMGAFSGVFRSEESMQRAAETYNSYIRQYQRDTGKSASEAWKDFNTYRHTSPKELENLDESLLQAADDYDWVFY